MIGTLLWNGWRERLSRPILVLLMVVAGGSMLTATYSGLYDELADPSGLMTLILAVGLVGRDVSSGTLALIFTRPIKRWRYIISRWVGASIAASAISWLHLIVQFLLLRSLGKGLPVGALFEMGFESATGAFGLTAVLVLFSTLVPGIADVGIWIATRMLVDVGERLGVPQRVGEHLDGLLSPELTWVTLVAGGTSAWFSVASYASNVVLCLAVAVAVINRKELSYASG